VKDKAAALLEEAKKLWGKLSSRSPRAAPKPAGEALSAVDVRLEALTGQLRVLEEEAAAAYEVVRSIAQQHSSLSEQHLQLIQAVDELAAKNRRLTVACAVLALLGLASLALAIARF